MFIKIMNDFNKQLIKFILGIDWNYKLIRPKVSSKLRLLIKIIKNNLYIVNNFDNKIEIYFSDYTSFKINYIITLEDFILKHLEKNSNLWFNYKDIKNKDIFFNKYNETLKNIFYNINNQFFKLNKIEDSIQPLFNIFISNDVIRDIVKNINKNADITFTFLDIKVELKIFFNNFIPILFINTIINKIIFIISLFHKNNKPNQNNLKIQLWLSNIKKNFDKEDTFLGIKNINSGCSIFKSNKLGEIIIWRKEECEKVLIHELIHSFHIDNAINDDKLNKKILSYFDILDSNYINIFECYTEIWAILFNSIFNSILNNKNFFYLIKCEILFNLTQVANILLHFKYTSFDGEFFHLNKKSTFSKKYKFNQGTSILSYYIFKSILLYNLDNFIHFCYKYNGKNSPWVFKGSYTNLFDFILDSLKKTKYIENINDLMIKNKNKKLHTLRMTFFN